ncbi:MAG: methylmalonyl-CoA mutase [Proteobacteria bacterium]|nr:methylmalonyl-CoA mutase [Pseudomonadota bacterium]
MTTFLSGQPPYRRGLYPLMYTQKPWTIRQYAGFSTAEESNAFYKKCLEDGQTGLSIAFDLATHRGYDSDHPEVEGDVGQAGVAIDSVEDMKNLFKDIPLDQVSVSMTMNGAVIPIIAFYIVAAEEAGISLNSLRGTLQNDILKEFMVRNTYIYPPVPSLRITTDIIAFCTKHMPLFNPISISGYHIQEAGAPPYLELALTLANGLTYVKEALKRGLLIDDFAPRLSFFFAIGMDFFTEIAKLRAARELWYELLQPFKPQKPQSSMLRLHCQTSGVSLTAQDPYNNIVRTTLEALAAVLGGTQSLHTNSFDEAWGLPTPESARIARHTQLILQNETSITQAIDPLGGSEYIESLTQNLIHQARTFIQDIESSGMIEALEKGIPQSLIQQEALKKQIALDQKKQFIVGVNGFQNDILPAISILFVDSKKVLTQQKKRLKQLKSERNSTLCQKALQELECAAQDPSLNILESAIKAVRARATLGEISLALENVFGRYQVPFSFNVGIFYNDMKEESKEILKDVLSFEKKYGRRPRILLAKLGQDGHDRGLKILATAYADCGFDVDIAPLFQTSNEIGQQAIDNDVHLIGISSHTGGHKILIPQLWKFLKKNKADNIKIVLGGIIPFKDMSYMKQNGVLDVFIPGTPLTVIVKKTLKLIF